MYKALTVFGPESRMVLGRYDDGPDAPHDVKPEQHRGHGGSAGDAPAARAEPAELRTRAECYEALRAADGKPVDGVRQPRCPSRRAARAVRLGHRGSRETSAAGGPRRHSGMLHAHSRR